MQFTVATHIFTEHLLHAIYRAELCIYFMFHTELSFIEGMICQALCQATYTPSHVNLTIATLDSNSSLEMRKLKGSYVTSLSPKSCNDSPV